MKNQGAKVDRAVSYKNVNRCKTDLTLFSLKCARFPLTHDNSSTIDMKVREVIYCPIELSFRTLLNEKDENRSDEVFLTAE